MYTFRLFLYRYVEIIFFTFGESATMKKYLRTVQLKFA